MTTAVAPVLSPPSIRAVARPRPRLAYLTTEYPKTSHTFIRREILELERRGFDVLRLSIRACKEMLAEPLDMQELERTWHCLSQPKWKLIGQALLTVLRRPRGAWRAAHAALTMARRSDRGMVVHAAYLIEAAVLLRRLTGARIDHVHVHFGTNAATVARLIHMLGGPPFSVTVHGPTEFFSIPGLSLAEKLSEAAFIVAISDFCAAQIKRALPYQHWERVHVVRCTIGEEFLKPTPPIADACRTLVCIGRLTAQKAQLLLLQAFRHALDAGADGQLVLAGDGEMRAEVEACIAKLRLQSHVTITGWIDEATVRDHLRNARALVLPSFAEGLPVVIMEAFGAARPVISTMVAGIPELVRHGENGWLVPAGNLEELTQAIIEVLHTPAERLNAMGRAGRQRVRERHFIGTEVDQLERLFHQYASHRPSTSQ